MLLDGHQEVIRELSALRQYLWKEKSQLEAQLGKKGRQESHFTPPNRLLQSDTDVQWCQCYAHLLWGCNAQNNWIL